MPFLFIIAVILLGLLVSLPSAWVRRQLKKHHSHREDFPGTGGELAEHLLERAGLYDYMVEPTEQGMDRFDPANQTVYLSRDFYTGKSISAIAVAAHEVSHAYQHARDERFFKFRMALVKAFMPINKIVGVLLLVGPLVSLVIRMPGLSLVFLALALFTLLFQFLVHLATLPVELDASFGKALPILSEGQYLAEQDLPAARSVLRAAALTYVAAAFAGLFNLFRLLRTLR